MPVMVAPLIQRDGAVFPRELLQSCEKTLEGLSKEDRSGYRNANAEAIATLDARHILVVSGPGTGKSTLFRRRIEHWLSNHADARVLVTSFVRKLVRDLGGELDHDKRLSDEQKRQVRVFTLHKLARSIVEQNHGTARWPFRPFFKIIAEPWDEVVWEDVVAFHPDKPRNGSLSRRAFDRYLHLNREQDAAAWTELEETYFQLCQFYNAAGFADLIIRAREATEERTALVPEQYFIIDEYQDFNRAEEAFLDQLIRDAKGVLVAGDDDQVLYEFKEGDPRLVRARYADNLFWNAMLPYCSRCGFHITKASAAFIRQHPEAGRIEKIYLPIAKSDGASRVEVIACAAPATAVDYIRNWLEEHRAAILQRQQDLRDGQSKEAYLLVLSPSRALKFLGKSVADLRRLIDAYRTVGATPRSEDYYRIAAYYGVGRYPQDSFDFRKALHYEGVSPDRVHELIVAARAGNCSFAELDAKETKDVLRKALRVKEIIKEGGTPEQQAARLGETVALENAAALAKDLEAHPLSDSAVDALQLEEEESAEQQESEAQASQPVELMTIVGAKGLSAEHVIIIGCDDVSMGRLSHKAFYVGLTRARKTLQLLVNVKAVGAEAAHVFVTQLPEQHTAFSKYTQKDKKVPLASKAYFRGHFERLAFQRTKNRTEKKG